MSRPRPARVVLDSAVSERQFQDAIVELATRLGWMWYHVPDSRRCPAGFPDLVLVRGDQLIFAELKTNKGKLRPLQVTWMEALADVQHISVRLWRPMDWPEIERTLGGRHE